MEIFSNFFLQYFYSISIIIMILSWVNMHEGAMRVYDSFVIFFVVFWFFWRHEICFGGRFITNLVETQKLRRNKEMTFFAITDMINTLNFWYYKRYLYAVITY